MAFILLSGREPFESEDNFGLLQKIEACNYSLEGSEWEGVSEDAKEFIRGLLVADPKKRMNI